MLLGLFDSLVFVKLWVRNSSVLSSVFSYSNELYNLVRLNPILFRILGNKFVVVIVAAVVCRVVPSTFKFLNKKCLFVCLQTSNTSNHSAVVLNMI